MIRLVIPVVFIAVAIGGICASNRLSRIVLWLLSLPPLGFGLFALHRISAYGLQVEKHDIFFLSAAFAPVAGCVAGEIIKKIKKINISTGTQKPPAD
jgi:hypothetical protein